MATAKLILDKRRQDKLLIDGLNDKNKYPIRIRIYHGVLNIEITLQYKFTTSEWIESENRVHKSFPNSARVNSAIQSRFAIVNTTLMNYSYQIENMDLASLKSLLESEIQKQINPTPQEPLNEYVSQLTVKESVVKLEKYGQRLIERAQTKKAFNTARWYKDGIAAIKRFNDNQDIAIQDITIAFLQDFEADHIAKGNSKNSISAYLRAVRSITNYAVTDVFKRKRFENYPWGNGGYSIPSKKTQKRAIKRDVINQLRALNLSKGSALWKSQKYFFWMFNNRGMNFIDIAKLKKHQIIDPIYDDNNLISGRLKYTRSKSDKDFSIKLTKESVEILNDFSFYDKKPDDFVFPIGFEFTKSGFETYRKKLTRNNERFRELARMIGQPELNLTTYVARHSWASIAKSSGISTTIISDGLGHSDFKTTQTYLEQFEDDVLDDANELIVASN